MMYTKKLQVSQQQTALAPSVLGVAVIKLAWLAVLPALLIAPALLTTPAYGADASSNTTSDTPATLGNRVVEEYTATQYAIIFDEKGSQSYNEGDFKTAAYFYNEAQRRFHTLGVQFPANAIAKYGEALTSQYYKDAVLLMENPAVAEFYLKEQGIGKTDGEGYKKLYDRVVKGKKRVKGKDDNTYQALSLYQDRLVYIIILDASIDLKGGEAISDKRWKSLEGIYQTLEIGGRYYSKSSLLLGWMRQVEASSALKP